MILIASSFFAVLLITFGLVSFATAPTRIDKTLSARLAAVTADKVAGVSTASLEASELLRKTATSRFDWIGQTLGKYVSMASLQKWISQAALDTTASALLVQTAAAAGIGFVITMFFAPIFGVELGVAGGCATLPWARVAFLRYRRLSAFDKALPHAIDMMARSLRAGHSTAAAIEIMAQGAAIDFDPATVMGNGHFFNSVWPRPVRGDKSVRAVAGSPSRKASRAGPANPGPGDKPAWECRSGAPR